MIATPRAKAPRFLRPVSIPAMVLAVCALASAGCESARRPVPRNPIARQHARQEGRALIERACAAAGGIERWRSIKDVSFRLDDRWHGWAGRMVRPWPVETA